MKRNYRGRDHVPMGETKSGVVSVFNPFYSFQPCFCVTDRKDSEKQMTEKEMKKKMALVFVSPIGKDDKISCLNQMSQRILNT